MAKDIVPRKNNLNKKNFAVTQLARGYFGSKNVYCKKGKRNIICVKNNKLEDSVLIFPEGDTIALKDNYWENTTEGFYDLYLTIYDKCNLVDMNPSKQKDYK